MKTFKRKCIKEYKLEASNGTLHLKEGKEYLTSRMDENRMVTVFTNFWVPVSIDIFDKDNIERFT